MNKQPAEWAFDRTHDLTLAEVDGSQRSYHADMQRAFARYIETHEDAPGPEVDPLEAVTTELYLKWFNGGDKLSVEAIIELALKRGMELATTQPDDPKPFDGPEGDVFLVDADGREVPVEFVSGPDAADEYRWRALGLHRPSPEKDVGYYYCVWHFHSDGNHPCWPIHLIRKGADA